MGVVTSLLSKLSKVALFLLLLAVLPGIPPHTEFEAFSVTPSIPLEGALALNSKLNGAERLLEGKVHGPEHLHVYNGQLYTTLHGGHVVRIVGDQVEPVIKFGQQCAPIKVHGPEHLHVYNGQLYTTLHGGHVVRIVGDQVEPVIKFGQQCEGFHEEAKCGRPLGLDFDKKGKMYVADAYYGIFKVDLTTGQSHILVSINDTVDGKKPMVPNSVAVGDDGSVYWTDSSTSHHLHDGLFICLANGNGRLLKYDPSTKSNSVLLDKLYFSNGVALADDGTFLVVCETVAHRIIKYHLQGAKAGESEVFVDGLPGMPDNIHADGRGGFVVSLVEPRDSEHASLVATIAPYPLVRKLLARLLYLTQRLVVLLRDLYPIDGLKKAAHLIGHFESVPILGLKRVSILFLTREGKVSRSLYATDGLTGVSDFAELGGYYYLGSPFNNFLARVKAS